MKKIRSAQNAARPGDDREILRVDPRKCTLPVSECSCCACASVLFPPPVQPPPRSASLLGNPRARPAHQDHRPPRQGRWRRCQVNGSLWRFIHCFLCTAVESLGCLLVNSKEGIPISNNKTIESHAIARVLARYEATEVLGAWGNLTNATLRRARLDLMTMLAGLGVRVFTLDPLTKEGNPRHPSPQGGYLPMLGPKVYLT